MPATSPDRLALTRAVLADPGDDTLRLVLADLLEEGGEGERATVIRLGVRSALEEDEGEAFVLDRQASELIDAHEWGRKPAWAEAVFWERGFLTEVRCTLAAFMQHAEALFRQHPITRVVLTDREPLPTGQQWRWSSHAHPNPLYSQRANPGASLPPALFERLAGFSATAYPTEYQRFYPNRQAAADALSLACVQHGRALAHLPPL